MKLHTQKNRRASSRLDGILLVVLVLWLATSMLLVILWHPGTARALHPQKPRPEMAVLLAPYATARASFI
jgi:hypothetical protein